MDGAAARGHRDRHERHVSGQAMDLSKHQQSLGRRCQSFRSSQTCSITVSFCVEKSASQTVQAAPLGDLQHPSPVLPQGGPAAHCSLCSNVEVLGRSGDAGWTAAALTDCEQTAQQQHDFEVMLSKKPSISSSLRYFFVATSNYLNAGY